MKHWKTITSIILVVLLLLTPSVYARAGGGTSSSSSSSSSGSSHGSSTNRSKDPKTTTLTLITTFGSVAYFSYYTKTFYVRRLKKQYKKPLKELKEALPYDLKSEVIDLYYEVQNAWKNQDIVEINQHVKKDLAEYWQTKLSWMDFNHQRNVMDMIHLINVYPFAVKQNHVFFYIHGIMIDYIEDMEKEEMISGSKVPKPFREYWEIELLENDVILAKIYQEDEFPISDL